MARVDWRRAIAVPSAEPTVVASAWIRNARGNLCRKIAGHWCTVYERDGRYRFVRNHVFSREAYATEREACEAACRS